MTNLGSSVMVIGMPRDEGRRLRAAPASGTWSPAAPAAARPTAPAGVALPSDVQRVRLEIQRLELLVKKLQSELEAERQYCQALEAHIRALQGCS